MFPCPSNPYISFINTEGKKYDQNNKLKKTKMTERCDLCKKYILSHKICDAVYTIMDYTIPLKKKFAVLWRNSVGLLFPTDYS